MSEGTKKRRTAEELAAHHEAQAAKHALRAKLSRDPLLRAAVSIRDELDDAPSEPVTDALVEALDAFIKAR